MNKPEIPSDKELNKAFDDTFAKPVNFDHKPTKEEIFTLELRAVSQFSIDYCYKDMLRQFESLMADGSAQVTFVRQRDNRSGVEECKLIRLKDWQLLQSQLEEQI